MRLLYFSHLEMKFCQEMAENKITNNKIQITYYSAKWLRYVAREQIPNHKLQITNLHLKDFFEILFRF